MGTHVLPQYTFVADCVKDFPVGACAVFNKSNHPEYYSFVTFPYKMHLTKTCRHLLSSQMLFAFVKKVNNQEVLAWRMFFWNWKFRAFEVNDTFFILRVQ